MTSPQLFLYRNKNKSRIAHIMNTIDWESNDDITDLATQDQFSMEQLKAMQLVARMKDAADKAGAGFVGGFISPTGQRFIMSNVDANDIQVKEIERQLDSQAALHRQAKLQKMMLQKMLEDFEG